MENCTDFDPNYIKSIKELTFNQLVKVTKNSFKDN